MTTKKVLAFASVAIVAVLAVVLVVNSIGNDSSSGTEIDGAFVSEMVPHHETAIEMAKLAQTDAQHPEIVNLANNIVSSQGDEIGQMDQINRRLYGSATNGQDHGDLGMDASMMGMNMDMGELKSAKPFDREFIDQMIPHHQGAIRMARVEISDGADPETKDLATKIVAAQSAEIDQMNRWRTEWYGSPSPAGGVPTEGSGDSGDSGHDMDSMSHMNP